MRVVGAAAVIDSASYRKMLSQTKTKGICCHSNVVIARWAYSCRPMMSSRSATASGADHVSFGAAVVAIDAAAVLFVAHKVRPTSRFR